MHAISGGISVYEQSTFLLQNQLNPFPISGMLRLSDEGALSFTLDAKAAGAVLGWLEKAIDKTGLKEQIESGQLPEVFSIPISGVSVKWPKMLGGYAMKFDAGDRTWIVSLNYPSGGAIWQTVNMLKAKGTTKPWKDALAAAGAK
jgi:hypothetical protein